MMLYPRALRILWPFALLVLVVALGGCGGSGGARSSTITGRITDDQGLPVRGARVWNRDSDTTSSTNGAFVLEQSRAGDLLVFAEFFQSGTRYTGQNLARTAEGEQTISINIMVAPVTQQALIRGTVEDRFGRRLEGASVFAYGAGAFSSARAITNSRGEFELGGLIAGVTYSLNAGGGDFASDTDTVALGAGERRTIRFVLGTAGFPALPAVTGLTSIAWTSQRVARGDRQAAAFEAVKREFEPTRATRPATRVTASSGPIEVQLEWTPLAGEDVLGYGIYRGVDGGPLAAVDFWRDPLAGAYLDGDVNLRPERTYTYEVTVLGTRFPDDPDSEGPGRRVSARPLGDLTILSVQYDPVRFSWRPVAEAQGYVVFVFDRFPGIGVTSIWNNQSLPTSETNLVYTGPALTPGATYHYLVLGLGERDVNGVWRSRTLSQVGELRP